MAEGFVDVEGGRLAYEAEGAGPTVVLIHPGLWDMRTWDDQFDTFARAHHTIRYDIRGYGRSTRPAEEPYSNVRDLLAVFDALEVERAALVGCSMGGGIAIDFVLEHPDRVWALVPAAAAPDGFEPLEEENDWWEERWQPVRDAIEANELERAEDLQIAIWAPLGTDDPAGRRIRQIAFDNIHELTMDESLVEELDPPAAHRLGDIDVPTLVVIAEHDPPAMRRAGDLLARSIPAARSVMIRGADHVVNMRQPGEFDRQVLAFLREAAG